MIKQKIIVPKGIRYISEWKEFSLPQGRNVFNKQLTGCGFTEFCITNNENVILCSPRKILLENKEEQHPEVLYVRNEFEKELGIDKDLGSSSKSDSEVDNNNQALGLVKQVEDYFLYCFNNGLPCKILVTYDSFRYVKEALCNVAGENLSRFYVVVDEMQAIFVDAQFKSDTELEFISQLDKIDNICFVSATPMMDEYLEMLDEFKDLPYYELDWKTAQPGRVRRPNLQKEPYKSLTKEAMDIINTYRSNKGKASASVDAGGHVVKIQSKEAVIYVNSVKNICDIIKKAGLTLEEANILCAKTPENEKKLRAAFGVGRGSKVFGHVPLPKEPHKMFTLCTRTVYLGADFYSTNARTFIFSDSNIKCLAVDISLDLPQILGRQRLDCNPWKNAAILYYKTTDDSKAETREEFNKRLENKKAVTLDLLKSYNSLSTEFSKQNMAKTYQDAAKTDNYQKNYVAVNTHGGKDLVPEFNNLVMVSEMRAFDIQQIDYRDRFSMFDAVDKASENFEDKEVDQAIKMFESYSQFPDKLRFACEDCLSNLSEVQYGRFIDLLPTDFQNYIRVLGTTRCWNLGYRKGNIEGEYNSLIGNQELRSDLFEELDKVFTVGLRVSKARAKEELRIIYTKLGYSKSPKATDLEEYFELRPCQITNPETGKVDNGFEIIKKR